ncbi:MAG: Sensor histidine kinase [Glaciihabitans sp.]|nr:Sensor histidine kinase [Glaciihabitans sp.]
MSRLYADPDGQPPRRPPEWLVSTVLVLFVIAPGFLPKGIGSAVYSSVLVALAVAITVVAVLLRVRRPVTAAGLAVAAAVVGMALDGPVVVFILGLLVCIFSVAKRTNRRSTFLVAVAAAVVVGVATVLFLESDWNDLRAILQFATFIGFAAAIGDATRSRRAFIVAITERARRAEETKESEALRRVAEERLRIARDLHDLLAHQIAVINMHSNVAAQALRSRPDDAEKSLATIRDAARTVLGEIGSLLSVLRAPDAGTGPGAAAPTPGLESLDSLLEEFTRTGLRLDVRREGAEYPVPEDVGVAAYRVIHEALTNANKHGSDHSALLHLEHGDGTLVITVTNTVPVIGLQPGGHTGAQPGGEAPNGGGGHGLVGVRERVAAVGGTLATTTGPGPVYRFTVVLPTTVSHNIPLPTTPRTR